MRYFLLLLWCASAVAADDQYSFKNYKIGQGIEVFKTEIPGCNLHADGDLKFCLVTDKIAGIPAEVMPTLINDKVATIYIMFSSTGFNTVAAAMTEKYGKPFQALTEKLKTQGGLEVDSTRLSWKKDGSFILLKQHDGSLSKASAYYSTDATEVILDKHHKELNKKNAQDL